MIERVTIAGARLRSSPKFSQGKKMFRWNVGSGAQKLPSRELCDPTARQLLDVAQLDLSNVTPPVRISGYARASPQQISSPLCLHVSLADHLIFVNREFLERHRAAGM